jgi:hypothetical protein
MSEMKYGILLLYVRNRSRQTLLGRSSAREYHSISEPSGPNHPLKEKINKEKSGERKILREAAGKGKPQLTKDGILLQIEVTFA